MRDKRVVAKITILHPSCNPHLMLKHQLSQSWSMDSDTWPAEAEALIVLPEVLKPSTPIDKWLKYYSVLGSVPGHPRQRVFQLFQKTLTSPEVRSYKLQFMEKQPHILD